MFQNNIIVAIRSLRKNALFSAINVLGLSVGITACMLIALYVRFELSYDDFHTDAANMYRVTTTVSLENEIITSESSTYRGIIQALKNDLPVVQGITVISPFDSEATFLRIIDPNEGVIPLTAYKGLYADESFFKVFSFPLVNGNLQDALSMPYSAVVSQSFARQHFGNNPIGRILDFKNDDQTAKQLTITGVMKDVPPNSHVKFDIVVTLPEEDGNFWDWGGHTYVKLKQNGDRLYVENTLNALARDKHGLKTDDDGQSSRFSVQPIRDIHLHSNLNDEFEHGGNALLVYALTAFAIIILIIGWINYVNLSTAILLQKMRQIAIRKIVGASRRTLTLQLLTESAVLNVAALMIAIVASWIFLSTFSDVIGIDASVLDFSDRGFWIGIVVFVLFSTAVSGGYPAVTVVSVNPVGAMGGKLQRQNNFSIKKGLLIVQFTITTILIAATITAYRQLTFMQKQDLGISIDQIMIIKAINFDQEVWSDSAGGYVVDPVYQQKALAFGDELRSLTGIANITSLSHLPGQLPDWGTEFKLEDIDPSKAYPLKAIGVDYDYIPTLGVKLLAGRNFSHDHPSDRGDEQQRAVIINETASSLLGFRNPKEAISRHISTYWGADYEIIGVVRSFHQLSLKEELTPLYFILQPRALSYFAIDLNSDNHPQTIRQVKSVWNHHFPGYPFDYLFLADYFNTQYQAEVRFSNVAGIFTIVGIILGCMGLFGLSSYAIAQRTKEIAIRKVLGASVTSVITMFSKDFVRLIVLANFLALPAAYYGISVWLDNYPYKTPITWWVFAAPATIVLILTVLTVSARTTRVAARNPAEGLIHP